MAAKRTKGLIPELPAILVAGRGQKAHEVLLREHLDSLLHGFFGGQRANQRCPPGIAVLVAAEDGGLVRLAVETGGVGAAVQRAHLLVLGVVVVAVGAARADEALDKLLAQVLIEVYTLAVEPVFTHFAADHPAVVVGPTADAVGPVVRLVVGALAGGAVLLRHPGLGRLSLLRRLLGGGNALLLSRDFAHLGVCW